MTMSTQNEEITTLYEQLAPTALNPENLEPWVSLTPPPGKLPSTTLEIGPIFFDLAQWAKSATPHYLTPPMKPEEFAALKEAIRRFGIVGGVIFINERGIVVDGYHRMMAILEHLQEGVKLDPPEVRFVTFQSKHDEYAFVLVMNVNRRMLDDEQKEELLKDILRSGHDGTDNWLSGLCKLSADKVKDVRALLENLPIEEGGIEFQDTRRSEAGKSYPQERREPESMRRRARAGLIDKPKTKATPKKTMDKAVKSSFVSDITPSNPVLEQDEIVLDAVSDVEVEIETPCDDEADENADLVLLIRAWWKTYHFLPVLSKDLAALDKDTLPSKREADAITRRLKPLVGSELGGHLILYKKLPAGVSAFILCPLAWCRARGIDRDVLINRAGTA